MLVVEVVVVVTPEQQHFCNVAQPSRPALNSPDKHPNLHDPIP